MSARMMKTGWWIGVAACFGAAILSELPQLAVAAVSDRTLAPGALAGQIVRWVLWGAFFGPLVHGAAYRLGGRRWGMLCVIFAALPVMLLYSAAAGWLASMLQGRSGAAVPLSLLQPVIVFTLTAGYGLLVRNEERRSAAERARLEAEERFAFTRMELLRSELQPHFVFNALNTVSALARRDAGEAAAIAGKLRDLFQVSAVGTLPSVTTVAEEVAFTQKYLDIQRARFEERLRTSFTVEQGLEEALVPALLLQPLVENSIRHGMGRREGVTIEVQVGRDARQLRVSVVNNGVADERPVVEGVGLANTRARLRALYGEAARFRASRRGEGGFAVEVRIPCQMAAGS